MLATAAPAVKFPTYSTPEQAGCATADRPVPSRSSGPSSNASTPPPTQQQPIHQVEEAIFRELLAMGRDLLRAFLALSGDGDAGPTLTVPGEGPSDPPESCPASMRRRSPALPVDLRRGRHRAGRLRSRPTRSRPTGRPTPSAPAAVFVPVPAVARGLRRRRRPCRGDQETPDDPGVGGLGQGLGRPQPRAGQRRGTVPGSPADARSDRGGTDPGGDGRLQGGAVGALGTAARGGGDRHPAADVGEPAPRQGREGQQEEDGGGGRGLHDRSVRAHRRRGDRRGHEEEGRPAAARSPRTSGCGPSCWWARWRCSSGWPTR